MKIIFVQKDNEKPRTELTKHSHPSTTLGHDNKANDIDWKSLIIIYGVAVISEGARGLLMPTLLPMVRSHGGNESSLGIITAIYLLGRFCATIPIGFLSDIFSPQALLSFTCIIQALGHLIYALAPSLSSLNLGRCLVGIGSVSTSLSRNHITHCIPEEKRTGHFGNLAALQFAGSTALPVIGGLLTGLPPLTFNSTNFFTSFPLTTYTYPAYLLVVTNIICTFIVLKYYKQIPLNKDDISLINDSNENRNYDAIASQEANVPSVNTVSNSPRERAAAIIICLLLNVSARSIITIFETVSVPFLCEQFNIQEGQASVYISTLGVIGMATFFTLRYLSCYFSDRKLIRRSLYLLCFASFVQSIPSISKKMNIYTYVAFVGLSWSIGTPISQTANLSLFSKILKGLPIGGLIGVFSASGSIAPLGAAILATTVWSHFGKEAVFATMLVITLATLILVIAEYKKLDTSPRNL